MFSNRSKATHGAGKMRHSFKVYAPTAPSGLGDAGTPQLVLNVRGDIEFLVGQELYSAKQFSAETTHKLTIRYSTIPTSAMTAKDAETDDAFQILYVDQDITNRRFTTLYVKHIGSLPGGGDLPDLDDPVDLSTKTYIDTQDAATLTAAEAYTDGHGGASQSYVDTAVSTEAAARATAVTAEATARASADALLQALSAKDAASGYAGLDANAILKLVEIPKSLLTGGTSTLPVIRSLKVAQIIRQVTSGAGDLSLYTVPAGKRATIMLSALNLNGATLTYILKMTIGASTFQIGASATLANNANSTLAIALNSYPIGEAGDVFVINVDKSGVNLFGYILTWDDSEGMKSARLVTPASGDNVVYTCPTGKVAIVFNASNAGNAPFRLYNNSGGTRTYKWNNVPNAGSAAAANQLVASKTIITASNSNDVAEPCALAAGDFISINVDANATASIAVLENVMEIDA